MGKNVKPKRDEDDIVSARIEADGNCVISNNPSPKCLMCDSLHSVHCLRLMYNPQHAIQFTDSKSSCTGKVFLTSGPEMGPCPDDFQGDLFILRKNINGENDHRQKRSIARKQQREEKGEDEDEFADPELDLLEKEFGRV